MSEQDKKAYDTMVSVGKDAALAIYETKWWEREEPRKITEIQLFTQELIMPFDKFHEAVEATLGRPVFTHEFGLNLSGLHREFLIGPSERPSLEDIVNLIPEEKRVLVTVPHS